MGISDRMKQMNAAILSDTKSSNIEVEAKQDAVFSKDDSHQPSLTTTAPGGMMVFRQHLLKHEATVKVLEAELLRYREGVQTLSLQTNLIKESKWANRHPSSFITSEFQKFKDEIAHAGGNVQPILVRPSSLNDGSYEIVFGHRRFTACKQLGLSVLAMVIAVSDQELFTLMDRENRHRTDLSPFEQGEMWNKALDSGLFSSARQLASHIGISHTLVNQCLVVARLPSPVIACFTEPTQIQLRWANALCTQFETEPKALMIRAEEVRMNRGNLSSAKVFQLLMGADEQTSFITSSLIKSEGKVIGKWSKTLNGEIKFTVKAGILDNEKLAKLQALTADFLVESSFPPRT